MATPPAKDIVRQTVIAEAAGDGEEGMYHVASTMVNRATQRKLSLDQVVNQPFQYTGRFRKDLDQFTASQPPETHTAAAKALQRAQQKPASAATHYMTTQLYKSNKRPSWANSPKMKPVGTVGRHIFFQEVK